MTILRNLENEDSRDFWRAIDEGAKEVDEWPPWKRRLIVGERDEEDAEPRDQASPTTELTESDD